MKILILFMVIPLTVCHGTRLRMDAFRVMFGYINNKILTRTQIKIGPPKTLQDRESSIHQRRAIKYFMRYLKRKIEIYA